MELMVRLKHENIHNSIVFLYLVTPPLALITALHLLGIYSILMWCSCVMPSQVVCIASHSSCRVLLIDPSGKLVPRSQ